MDQVPDLSALDDLLAEQGVDGYLIRAAGDDSDQRYLSGFDAPDPFVTLYDGDVHLLVSSLEYGRARKESRAATVARHADYDFREKVESHGQRGARDRVLRAFIEDHGATELAVPETFPVGVADALRELDVSVTAEREGVMTRIRAVKTDAEIEHVRTAQQANERAMARAEQLIREAEVDGQGRLSHDGDVLTSERVKREIEMELLRADHALDETIVACGRDAADPHDRGSGPLRVDQPVIVDIFPRGKESGYFADMTRTFLKGESTETVREWYDLTARAQDAALAAIEPGATGEAVHDAVCDVYEDAGLPTLRDDEGTETGFIHSTGHGVGLDIHELPQVATGGEQLEPGNVITVEPGLYDPEVGGVRIEDLVVVTEDGYENLTDYPRQLVV
jgi:Xaa-Pro aminopeptidase